MIYLRKAYKPKEFLKKFKVWINTSNKKTEEEIKQILENAEEIVVELEFPDSIFDKTLYRAIIDEELLDMLREVTSDEYYRELVSNYFYNLLVKMKLNKLVISPYKITTFDNGKITVAEYTSDIISEIAKHIGKVPYRVIIRNFNLKVQFHEEMPNEWIEVIDGFGICYVFLHVSLLEWDRIERILINRLKDYIKALLI